MMRPPVAIRAVVLDYGEVLCEPADPAAMDRMARDAGLEPAAFRELYWALREDYDRGTFDGPAYWRRFGERAGVAMSETLIRTLIEQDIELWTRIEPGMVAWADALIRRGVRVALLSNMVREIGGHLRDTIGLFRHFTHVTFSYEIGAVKPEPAIYRHVLAGVGVEPAEALLIDDRPVNIEGARALGMHGLVFAGHAPLLASLDDTYRLVGGS